MIKIILGNVGSGKTAFAVREMYLNHNNRKTYSNITTKIKHQVNISPEMIIKKTQVDTRKKRTGEIEPVYEYKLNIDYWKNIKEPINVILDEAHSIVNARRSMSKTNIIITDWLALIRRVLGQTEQGYGELVFITQLSNRIDIIARDMATNVIYTICHYLKTCSKCGTTWQENSELPEPLSYCINNNCRAYSIKKHTHYLELWHFAGMPMYQMWKEWGQKSFYKHYFIKDIEKYFKFYSTLQWDNLFSEFY